MGRKKLPSTIKEPLQRVDVLVRLIESDQPFQPVLAATIDANAWRAQFVVESAALRDVCHDVAPGVADQACKALADLTGTIFLDSYLDRFHAANARDLDPQEFLPPDEFFDDSAIWQKAVAHSEGTKLAIVEHIRALDERWHDVSLPLHKALTQDLSPAILAALQKTIEGRQISTEIRRWTSALPDTITGEKGLRDLRVHVQEFIIYTLLPELAAAVKQAALPKRSAQQSAKKRLMKNATDVLAACHLRQGWERLRGLATTAVALRLLLTDIFASLSGSFLISPPGMSGKEMLELLAEVPREVLDDQLVSRWQSHLKDGTLLQAAVSSIQILERGAASIGKNTLSKVLQSANESPKPKGWVDKADERLHKLGAAEIAFHGSENWVAPTPPKIPREKFQAPRNGYGWLVNPLLVVLDEVREKL